VMVGISNVESTPQGVRSCVDKNHRAIPGPVVHRRIRHESGDIQ
jgi:hypothetical protein